jgi:hypothetical protein
MYGFLDEAGNTVLKPRYPNLGVASENLISFMRKNRYGFIDMAGEKVIPASYREVRPFSEGLAGMNYGGQWGYIDANNVTVIKPIYDEVQPFQAGVAAVYHGQKKRWGVIDRVGETVLPFTYKQITRDQQGWMACQKYNEHWEYFDPHGIRLSHRNFENAQPLTDGLAVFNLHQRKNIINIYGIPITYPGYNQVTKAGREVIITETNKLQGLMDRQGNEIIPPIYESVDFIDGYYRVARHGEIGYLYQNGSWLYPLSK